MRDFDLPGAYVRDFVAIAARHGITESALLAGLPVRDLADPTTRVPLKVCEAIAARANVPALGLEAGLQMTLSSHGFLGFAAMTAATVRDALELAVRFASTRTSAIALSLHVAGARAAFVVEERTDLGHLRETLVLALLVGLWRLGTSVTGLALDGTAEVTFARPPYLAALPVADRMRFSCASNRLVFDARLLDVPLTAADPVASALARAQCERELAALGDDVVTRVRRELPASLPAVAKALKLSPRTLKRRLAASGTTFTHLHDAHRRETALLLVADRALAISDVAARLGYTELPNFTRAFRRWTGVTPQAYRRDTLAW